MLRAFKKLFARHVTEEAPSDVSSHASDRPAAAAPTALPPPPEPISTDVVISRFEPLLVHAPRNIKVIKTLAEAYARKMMFDQSLSLYRRASEIVGGRNTGIERSIEETTQKKLQTNGPAP